VFIINKLSKDIAYKKANETYLIPLWNNLAQSYSEYKNLVSLNKE